MYDPADPIGVYIKYGEPVSAWSMLENPLSTTMTRGVLDLATISFSLVDAIGSNQGKVMILSGLVNWDSGGTGDFNWTFVDHATGHGQTLLTLLNDSSYNGKGGKAPQVTLESAGGDRLQRRRRGAGTRNHGIIRFSPFAWLGA